MTQVKMTLKDEVQKLAEEAFHKCLISGYGEGEYEQEYQIVYKGKPRHVSLEYAHAFLDDLLKKAE